LKVEIVEEEVRGQKSEVRNYFILSILSPFNLAQAFPDKRRTTKQQSSEEGDGTHGLIASMKPFILSA
jgi:hypothetical protein